MDRLRSSDKIHLSEEQYLCFSKIAKHSKYAGKTFTENTASAYPSWQQLMENSHSHPYFIWPTINGWLGPLKLGLKELKCPGVCELYSDIQKAYEHCQSMHQAQQTCRWIRRDEDARVMCYVYFVSLGEGLFQVSFNPPAGKKPSDLKRWSIRAMKVNDTDKRNAFYQLKVKKRAMEAKQVNRVGQTWNTQLLTMDQLVKSIPTDNESTSLKKELPLGFDEEIQRAISSCLVTAQKRSKRKFRNDVKLYLGGRLQTLARKRIHKQICKLKK